MIYKIQAGLRTIVVPNYYYHTFNMARFISEFNNAKITFESWNNVCTYYLDKHNIPSKSAEGIFIGSILCNLLLGVPLDVTIAVTEEIETAENIQRVLISGDATEIHCYDNINDLFNQESELSMTIEPLCSHVHGNVIPFMNEVFANVTHHARSILDSILNNSYFQANDIPPKEYLEGITFEPNFEIAECIYDYSKFHMIIPELNKLIPPVLHAELVKREISIALWELKLKTLAEIEIFPLT